MSTCNTNFSTKAESTNNFCQSWLKWNKVISGHCFKPHTGNRALNSLYRLGATWRLMEKFWSSDCKLWSPTYFICNFHKNAISYIALLARRVTIEERKQFETTQVSLSYKATIVLRWYMYVSGPKVMVVSVVFIVRQTRVLAYSFCYFIRFCTKCRRHFWQYYDCGASHPLYL